MEREEAGGFALGIIVGVSLTLSGNRRELGA